MTYTPAQLQERTLHRRAIEGAIWGIPAVNYDAMYQAGAIAAPSPAHSSFPVQAFLLMVSVAW